MRFLTLAAGFLTFGLATAGQAVDPYQDLSGLSDKEAVAVLIERSRIQRLTSGSVDARLARLAMDIGAGAETADDIALVEQLFEEAFRRDSGWAASAGNFYWNHRDDIAQAIAWYRRGVAKGSELAMFALAERYRTGSPGIQDMGKAVELYEQAAKLGLAHAHGRLGVIYFDGHYRPKDYVRALRHFEADTGSSISARYVSEIYAKGLGVPRNLQKAGEALILAASMTDSKAIYEVAEMYRSGNLASEQPLIDAQAWYLVGKKVGADPPSLSRLPLVFDQQSQRLAQAKAEVLIKKYSPGIYGVRNFYRMLRLQLEAEIARD